jgi:amino acid transporter
MRVGSLGIATLAFAHFTFRALGLDPEGHDVARTATALTALWAVTAVNMFGVRGAARTQVALTGVKVLALIVLIGLAVAHAAGALGLSTRVLASTPPTTRPDISAYALALIPVMWTLSGWDESPFVAEEVSDPARNLPRSVLGGLISVGLLFVLVNGAYLLVLTPAELAASGTQTATLFLERTLGEAAGTVLAVVLMLSTLGSTNGLTLTGARIVLATGRDNPMLSSLAVVEPRTGTPNRALVTQAALATVAICALPNPFELLLYTGVAYWVFAALTALAVIVLRRRDPHATRPFTVPGYPALPLLFTAISVAMAIAVGLERPRMAIVNLTLIAVGALTFGLQSREGRGHPR